MNTLSLFHAPRLAWGRPAILALAAIIGSALIALWPLPVTIGLMAIAGVMIGTLIEPGIGLIVTLLAGPWAAWMNTYYPGLLPIDAGQILVGFTLGAWVLGGLVRRDITIPRSPILIPLVLFVGWAAITLLWAPDLSAALPEVIKWIEIVLVMLLALDVAQRRGLRWVLTGIFATTALQALIGIYEARVRGVGPLGFQLSEGVYRAYGTFEQPNPFAGFVGMVLPLAIAVTTYCVLRIRLSLIAYRLSPIAYRSSLVTRHSSLVTHHASRSMHYSS